jgi:TetR/AcrR family transcriptional regulator, transcriptional repressor for nem operon
LNDQSSDFRPATRDRIVEAARQLFFQQGFTATGLAQILKAAEARSGSLYHFFPSKRELLQAVLQKYLGLLEPNVLRPAFERTSDPVERLFAVLDGYRGLLHSTGFQLGCPIGNLALEVSTSQPDARRLIAENFEAWSIAIRALIESFADRLPPGVSAAALARHTQATMEGAIMLARAYQDFEPFDQAVGQLRDYVERLLRDGSARNAS